MVQVVIVSELIDLLDDFAHEDFLRKKADKDHAYSHERTPETSNVSKQGK